MYRILMVEDQMQYQSHLQIEMRTAIEISGEIGFECRETKVHSLWQELVIL